MELRRERSPPLKLALSVAFRGITLAYGVKPARFAMYYRVSIILQDKRLKRPGVSFFDNWKATTRFRFPALIGSPEHTAPAPHNSSVTSSHPAGVKEPWVRMHRLMLFQQAAASVQRKPTYLPGPQENSIAVQLARDHVITSRVQGYAVQAPRRLPRKEERPLRIRGYSEHVIIARRRRGLTGNNYRRAVRFLVFRYRISTLKAR